MNALSLAAGTLVYLDANIFIYASEGSSTLSDPLRKILQRIDAGELRSLTSELTLAEVLVKPLRQKDAALLDLYRRRIRSGPALEVTPVSRAILEKSAELRSQGGSLKLPDAIHAASAMVLDARFSSPMTTAL